MKKNLDASKKKLAVKTKANEALQTSLEQTKNENAELQQKVRSWRRSWRSSSRLKILKRPMRKSRQRNQAVVLLDFRIKQPETDTAAD
jgi:hypothetical protein